MLTDGPIKPAYVLLTIAIAAFVLGVWLDTSQPRLCGPPDESCAREWFGALSGWFAGIAALITGWFLLGQLRLMRRQTDFMLGLTDPTIVARDPRSDFDEVGLRVVNWSRSEIEIGRVRCVRSSAPLEIALSEARVDGDKVPVKMDPSRSPPIRVPGWIARTGSPPMAEILLMTDTTRAGTAVHATFAVEVTMLEENHRKLVLTASTIVTSILD